jgi:3-hydroxyisobutyrate dehydrogenase-like beta-hydroxyacid dehydrogenase
MTQVGIVHPGQMGISVAASARNSGCTVMWAGAGRSAATQARAQEQGLHDAGTLAELVARCEVIVSVCPPHAAEQVAGEIMALGFSGVYLDGNAIAPARARRIATQVHAGGARFVDGGIIGGPAWKPGTTCLYLSGPDAAHVAACFAAGPLETRVIGHEPDKASALKMCYAAYTKGTTALLAAILGAAETLGVRGDLMDEWGRDGATFGTESEHNVRAVTAKAWRFVGEMEEIAATLAAADMPAGFHLAAADIYTRLADFKDAPTTPELDDVLAALAQPPRP